MSEEDKRFVIQKHTQGKNIHWDFMLESGEALQTYRLDKAPEEVLHQTANAVRIFNHPLKFLTYQGPVNKGRGSEVEVEDPLMAGRTGPEPVLSLSEEREF